MSPQKGGVPTPSARDPRVHLPTLKAQSAKMASNQPAAQSPQKQQSVFIGDIDDKGWENLSRVLGVQLGEAGSLPCYLGAPPQHVHGAPLARPAC